MKIQGKASISSPEPPSVGCRTHHAPAWVLSLVLHFCILTASGLFLNRQVRGTGESPDRQVGIALVQPLPDRTEYVNPNEISPVEPEKHKIASSNSGGDSLPAGAEAPLDLEGILEELTSPTPFKGSTEGIQGDALQAVGNRGTGKDAIGEEGQVQTTAALFGVSGSGARFVYVVDRSDSMNGFQGRPLLAAKSELRKSLNSLSERQEFQIILYNTIPKLFLPAGNVPRMFAAETSMRIQAERYLNNAVAFGGTEHMGALLMALRLRPDVLFFLTDARVPRLNTRQLRKIQNQAFESGTTIHAIEFGTDASSPSESFLRTLAADNRGQYRYIDVRRIRPGGNWTSPSNE